MRQLWQTANGLEMTEWSEIVNNVGPRYMLAVSTENTGPAPQVLAPFQPFISDAAKVNSPPFAPNSCLRRPPAPLDIRNG